MSRVVVKLPEHPENGDGITYRVPSRRKPKPGKERETYHVELTGYRGNGQCTCPSFLFRLSGFLSRLVAPEVAVEQGLVKLKKGQDPRDALRCPHIVEARRQFTDDVLRAIAEKNAAESRAGAARGFREA